MILKDFATPYTAKKSEQYKVQGFMFIVAWGLIAGYMLASNI